MAHQLRPERPAGLPGRGRTEQLPPCGRVRAHLAAGLQPAHRQAGAGAGRAAARTHHAPREPDRRRPRLRAQGGELLDDLDGTLLGIRGVAATRMGEVTVACVPSTVYYYLSQVIRRYRERYPKVRVKVLDASANEVLAAVAAGRGRLRVELHRQPGRRASSSSPWWKSALWRLPARPSAGQDAPRQLARSGRDYDYISVRQDLGQPPAAGPGPGRRDRAAAGGVRGPARDHHAGPGRGRARAWPPCPPWPCPGPTIRCWSACRWSTPVVSRKVGLIRRRGRSLSPAAQQLFDLFSEVKAGKPVRRAGKPVQQAGKQPRPDGKQPAQAPPPKGKG
jgi:DNA-binding transcriptional LysR family regulator